MERAYPDRRESSSGHEAFIRVFKHRFHLILGNPWKPFDEIIDSRAVFQILEKRRNGYSCSTKNPSSAHYFRRALHRMA